MTSPTGSTALERIRRMIRIWGHHEAGIAAAQGREADDDYVEHLANLKETAFEEIMREVEAAVQEAREQWIRDAAAVAVRYDIESQRWERHLEAFAAQRIEEHILALLPSQPASPDPEKPA